MPLLLHIETSTTMCSVALADEGHVMATRTLNQGYTHAENLHVFIQQVLEETGTKTKDLSAVCVSRGPGSYTGLRIGVSTAKGLCFALKIPLLSADTLQVMTASLNRGDFPDGTLFCPMLDARRMEVYTACYTARLERVGNIEALILDDNSLIKFKSFPSLVFFGDGMPKCRSLLSTLPSAQFVDGVAPLANHMAVLGWEKFKKSDFEDVAYFEPYYLKEFMFKR